MQSYHMKPLHGLTHVPYCNLLSRYCGVSHAGSPGDFQILRLDLNRYLPDSVPLLAVCCFKLHHGRKLGNSHARYC